MTIETIYKAVNGISFNDKDSCERYEARLIDEYENTKERTKFYDKNFNILPFPTIEEFYRGQEYKYLDDIDIISTERNYFSDINEFFDRAGYCTKIINQPSEIDLYIYDDGECDYLPIDEKAIEALTFVKKLQSLGLIPGLEQIIAQRETIEYIEEDANE
ncbi:MAG: hypothetical protein ACI3ZZ_06070 [Candidatus Aphodosoma sp.]